MTIKTTYTSCQIIRGERRRRNLVRPRTRIHTIQPRSTNTARLAQKRRPRPCPRPLLLFRRSRKFLRPFHHRRTLPCLPLRRYRNQRYQRRSHAGSAGVPGGTVRGHRCRRSIVHESIHPPTYMRGVPSVLHVTSQTHCRGGLERCRDAYQCIHQEYARTGRDRCY